MDAVELYVRNSLTELQESAKQFRDELDAVNLWIAEQRELNKKFKAEIDYYNNFIKELENGTNQ